MVREFRRKFRTQEHVDRHHHERGIVHVRKHGRDILLRFGSEVFLPAVGALLFARNGEHHCRRVQAVNVGDVRHLHGIQPAEAHAVALRDGRAKHEFCLLNACLAGKGHLGAGRVEHALRNAERVVLVEAHLFLHLVLHFHAFRHFERHALFLELREGLKAFRTGSQGQEFGTCFFGLKFHLGQVLASHAHVLEQAGTFRHQGIDLLLAFLVLVVEHLAFLVCRLAVLPAGGNCHVAFFAGFFQVGLRAVEFCALLYRIDVGRLLGKRKRGKQSHRENSNYRHN